MAQPQRVLDLEKLKELAAAGSSLSVMSKALGCSDKAIRNACSRHGIERNHSVSLAGEKNPRWKGGRQVDKDGYVLVYSPDHPYRDHKNRVREHRLIIERQIGRYLLPGEVVDHRDGTRSNNDESNLRPFATNAEHLRTTLTGNMHLSDEARAKISQAGRLYQARKQNATPTE